MALKTSDLSALPANSDAWFGDIRTGGRGGQGRAIYTAAELQEFICEHQRTNGQHSLRDPRPGSAACQGLVGRDLQSIDVDRNGAVRESPADRDLLRDAQILIVDDCTLDRENLAAIFVANGTAPPSVAWDLSSLITALEDTKPSIVLLSVRTCDSVLLLRAALQISSGVRVIALGVSADDEGEIVACAEGGVAGYHMRTESLDDLLVLIRRVAAGESVCSPGVSAILLRRLSALAAQRQPAARELVLTPREAQILRMLEMGLSNRDIASQLCIAVHTVKNHVHSLLHKLGVGTRAEAAALFRSIRYTEGDHRN